MNAFEQRRRERSVPPAAHGSLAWTTAERQQAEQERASLDMSDVRLDIAGRTYTVADLQRAMARETER